MRRGGQLLPAVSTKKDKGFSNTESSLLEICTSHSQEDIEYALDMPHLLFRTAIKVGLCDGTISKLSGDEVVLENESHLSTN